jgi:hypothetical protein
VGITLVVLVVIAAAAAAAWWTFAKSQAVPPEPAPAEPAPPPEIDAGGSVTPAATRPAVRPRRPVNHPPRQGAAASTH